MGANASKFEGGRGMFERGFFFRGGEGGAMLGAIGPWLVPNCQGHEELDLSRGAELLRGTRLNRGKGSIQLIRGSSYHIYISWAVQPFVMSRFPWRASSLKYCTAQHSCFCAGFQRGSMVLSYCVVIFLTRQDKRIL